MHPDDELPAGWLTQFRRGVLSGAGLLLLATGLCAIPAFVVWLVPGADTTPASVSVKAGALLALSAPRGGVVLDGTPVTVAPLLVTLLLGWLVVGQVRRADSSSAALGLAIGYGLASGALAGWARIGATHAPVVTSMLAAGLFVLAVGVLTRAWQRGWPVLTERWQRVLRAAGAAAACYLIVGSLLVAGALVTHYSDALAVQRQLSSGGGGLPVALLGIAALPNAVLAAVGYLTGPGFSVGSHTSVSVLATSHGRLPSFPLLAAIPDGRPVPVLGGFLIVALAVLAGWLVSRVLLSHESWLHRLADQVAAAALAGALLAGLAGLGSGSLGTGALRGIGESWWAVGCCASLAVLFGAAGTLAVELALAGPARPDLDLNAEELDEAASAKAKEARAGHDNAGRQDGTAGHDGAAGAGRLPLRAIKGERDASTERRAEQPDRSRNAG